MNILCQILWTYCSEKIKSASTSWLCSVGDLRGRGDILLQAADKCQTTSNLNYSKLPRAGLQAQTLKQQSSGDLCNQPSLMFSHSMSKGLSSHLHHLHTALRNAQEVGSRIKKTSWSIKTAERLLGLHDDQPGDVQLGGGGHLQLSKPVRTLDIIYKCSLHCYLFQNILNLVWKWLIPILFAEHLLMFSDY